MLVNFKCSRQALIVKLPKDSKTFSEMKECLAEGWRSEEEGEMATVGGEDAPPTLAPSSEECRCTCIGKRRYSFLQLHSYYKYLLFNVGGKGENRETKDPSPKT